MGKVILYLELYDFVLNLYPYSSRFALVSDARASCEGRGKAPAPQAGLGGRLHRGQRSPSPGKQTEHSLGLRKLLLALVWTHQRTPQT